MKTRMLKWLSPMLIAIACSFANAEESVFKDQGPTEYRVVEGDTLWGIAEHFLSSPWYWPEIWHANPGIANPHLIYPGDLVQLVYIDGKPMLTVQRSGQTAQRMADGTVKVSPNSRNPNDRLSPTIRSTDLKSSIPAIPLESIQSFLVDHRIETGDALSKAPYVIAGQEEHIIMGQNDLLYARGTWDGVTPTFGVFRKGQPFFDPDNGELLGYETLRMGLAKVLEVKDDIGRLRVVDSSEEIRIDDLLLPTEERKIDSVFYPSSPKTEVVGKIMHVFSGVRHISLHDVVVINKGRDVLKPGNVLAIMRVGEQVRDRRTNDLIQLPEERAGMLMIFRTFEKTSFGLVIRASSSIRVKDMVKNP